MTRPLRIALFTGAFPAISETFIIRQVISLLDLGHEVDIYSNAPPDPAAPMHPEALKRHLLSRTLPIPAPPETCYWEMPVWPLTGRTWPPGSADSVLNIVRIARAWPSFFRSLRASPRLTFQLLSPAHYGYQAASLSGLYRLATLAAVNKKYDVLHAHFGPVANSFRFARQLWNAPFLASFHGYDFSTLPRQEGPAMYHPLFAAADGILVNSEWTRRQVEKLGCPPAKIFKLPVGLDPKQFPFRERSLAAGEPVRLLTVARLVEIKGHEFVLRALAQVREKCSNLRYDIVGDGPLREALEKLAGQLGLQEVVAFHGACDSAAVRQFLDAAHLFVLASVSIEGDQEGQGLALQEAQAAGLPVIATAHGAFPEGMTPGESGFLVPERDPAALAERIWHLLQHPELWPEMGKKGSAFVREHYDMQKLTLRLLEIYSECIEKF